MVPIHSNLAYTRLAISSCLWILPCLAVSVSCASDYDIQYNKWSAAQARIQSWSADFTQTRSLMTLTQPLVSTGRVWVKIDQFRWELGQPPQTIVLRRPDELRIIYPRFKRAEVYSFLDIPPGPIKDAMTLLDAILPRDRATMAQHFKLLSATQTNSMLQMTLQPKSASARQFISMIIIGFRTNDFAIAVTEMKFSDGSVLRNDFTHVVINKPMDAGLFETNLPADYSVVEPFRQ